MDKFAIGSVRAQAGSGPRQLDAYATTSMAAREIPNGPLHHNALLPGGLAGHLVDQRYRLLQPCAVRTPEAQRNGAGYELAMASGCRVAQEVRARVISRSFRRGAYLHNYSATSRLSAQEIAALSSCAHDV